LLIAERVRRDNDRLRDQLRQVENTIRTEESSRSRMKEDMNVARRNLDQAREEMRRLETSQRGMYNQEEEQRRRILLERERLEAEKRRFAEERLDEEHSRNTAREMKQNIERGKVQRNLCSILLHHCHISDWSNTEIVISDGWCDASSSLYFRV